MFKISSAFIFMGFLSVITVSCSTIPKGATAVSGFEIDRYMGTWYEIARFDFRFERDLNNTTATYSLNPDGTVKVYNRGYNYVKNQWQDVTGKAKFVGNPTVAMFKVSFFGPFYAGYNVVALDPDYKYALIIGSSPEYMWILSRETTIPEYIKQPFLEIARGIGCETDNLIWVKHD